MNQLPPDAWQHLLRVTEDCVGCGICQQVCPSGSIRGENGRAVHTPGRCQTCLACIHACPHRAIQLTVADRSGPVTQNTPGELSGGIFTALPFSNCPGPG